MYSTERHFVKTAFAQMKILGIEDVYSQTVETNISSALKIIKTAALLVEARAVIRSAKLCEEIITRIDVDQIHTNEIGKLHAGLLSLKGLIGLYSEGLFEIDPAFELEMKGRTAPATPATKVQLREPVREHVSKISSPEAHTENSGLESVYLEGRHAAATEALRPLLRLVKDTDSLETLKILMQTTSIGVDTDQDVEPLTSSNVNMFVAHTTKFENLMRPITNLILSEARHTQKSVSVSYAADFEELGLDMAGHVQTCLEAVCLNIVASGIGKKATQISLTGQQREKRYRFSVNWTGKDIREQAHTHRFFKKTIADLHAIKGDIQFRDLALQSEISTHEDMGEGLQSLELSFPLTLGTQASSTTPKKQTPRVSSELVSDNLAIIGGASR